MIKKARKDLGGLRCIDYEFELWVVDYKFKKRRREKEMKK